MIFFSARLFLSCIISFSACIATNELIMVPKEMVTYFSWFENNRNQIVPTARFSPMEEEVVLERIVLLEKLLSHSHALVNFNKDNNNQGKITCKECVFGVDVAEIKAHLKKFKKRLGLVDSIKKNNEYSWLNC